MKYDDLHVNEASQGKVLTFLRELSRGNKSPQRPHLFSRHHQVIWCIHQHANNQIPVETNFTHMIAQNTSVEH